MASGGLRRGHVCEDAAGAEATTAAVMGQYNPIARELADSPGEYAPVLGMDANSGEASWIPWIDGFERAMWLRPDVGGDCVERRCVFRRISATGGKVGWRALQDSNLRPSGS